MIYSIGEAAKLTGVPASTLRYYDYVGLLPFMNRSNGGIRQFSDTEIDALKIIDCLKQSGLCIKDIQQFMKWCTMGNETLKERRDMFYERKAVVEKQLEAIQNTLATLDFKCWYYDTAYNAGNEDAPKAISFAALPAHIQSYYKKNPDQSAHKSR